MHQFKEILESKKLGLCKPLSQEEYKRPWRPQKEHTEFVGPKRPNDSPRDKALK